MTTALPKSADVIVVGGGNAAFCAALAAAEQGVSVLVLERAPEDEAGGNSRFTAGAFRCVYDGVEDLRKLMFGGALAKASSEQLKAWLLANKTGDTRLRARLPAGWRVGDKTGSGERGSTNDVGILWPPDAAPLIVAAYLTQTAASMNERNEALAAVGEAVAAAFRGHS